MCSLLFARRHIIQLIRRIIYMLTNMIIKLNYDYRETIRWYKNKFIVICNRTQLIMYLSYFINYVIVLLIIKIDIILPQYIKDSFKNYLIILACVPTSQSLVNTILNTPNISIKYTFNFWILINKRIKE